MRIITALTISGLALAVGLSAACSSASDTATTNTTAVNNELPKTEDETPASVKTAFPDAQSFIKQHKDIPNDQIAAIEKETNAKIPDTDHHSYLAFSAVGGTRKQIGAATIVKADGKEVVVVYENKEGRPFVKEIRAEGVSSGFLKQFAGKNHDDKFVIGSDLNAAGVDEPLAKAIAEAVRVDAMTMQTLYGAPDTH